jgi:hypothetical protein
VFEIAYSFWTGFIYNHRVAAALRNAEMSDDDVRCILDDGI